MGVILQFPPPKERGRPVQSAVAAEATGTILIFNGVRIERHIEAPENGPRPGKTPNRHRHKA